MALLRHLAVSGLFRLISLVFRLLPRRWALGLGRFLGQTARLLLPSQKRRVREHLAAAFPHWSSRKRDRCVRGIFRHFGLSMAELFHLDDLVGEVTVEGMEHLMEGGAILVTGHCGNWELMARTLGIRGPGLTVVAREAYLSTLNTFLVRLRAEGNVRTILRGSSESPRLLLKAVKEGQVLGMLIDQDTKVEGIFVDFFGRPAHTPVGASRLAIKYNIPVVTGFIHRTLTGGHHLRIDPPMDPAGYSERRLTKLLTMRIEAQIRRYPTQWVWVHRRWKKRPPEGDQPDAS